MANDLRWIGRHVPRFVLFLCPLRRAMANDSSNDPSPEQPFEFLCPPRRAMANDQQRSFIKRTHPDNGFLCPLRRAMANDESTGTPAYVTCFYALYVGLWLTTARPTPVPRPGY